MKGFLQIFRNRKHYFCSTQVKLKQKNHLIRKFKYPKQVTSPKKSNWICAFQTIDKLKRAWHNFTFLSDVTVYHNALCARRYIKLQKKLQFLSLYIFSHINRIKKPMSVSRYWRKKSYRYETRGRSVIYVGIKESRWKRFWFCSPYAPTLWARRVCNRLNIWNFFYVILTVLMVFSC